MSISSFFLYVILVKQIIYTYFLFICKKKLHEFLNNMYICYKYILYNNNVHKCILTNVLFQIIFFYFIIFLVVCNSYVLLVITLILLLLLLDIFWGFVFVLFFC